MVDVCACSAFIPLLLNNFFKEEGEELAEDITR